MVKHKSYKKSFHVIVSPGMTTSSPAYDLGDISMAAVVLSRCAVDPLATDRERRQEQASARMCPPVTKPVISTVQ